MNGFENVKKKSKWYPIAMVTNQNLRKGKKLSSRQPKYFKLEKMVQNKIFYMFL